MTLKMNRTWIDRWPLMPSEDNRKIISIYTWGRCDAIYLGRALFAWNG